ncbi:MAG: hypothetical protein HUJ26_16610 [Planctomycetaceae bacterium]|nr:hypothetical protein [Planctomycetaceae bacterium]
MLTQARACHPALEEIGTIMGVGSPVSNIAISMIGGGVLADISDEEWESYIAWFGGTSGDTFEQSNDFFAGWGDSLSFGLTSYTRKILGYDNVDYESNAYFWGQMTGEIHSLLMLFGNGAANIMASSQGGLRNGIRRYFWDTRNFKSTISPNWTKWYGKSRINGPHLHHALFPQRLEKYLPSLRPLINAGFNYLPTSRYLNSTIMNKYAKWGRPYEWLFRGGYLTQFSGIINPITVFFGGLIQDSDESSP